MTDEMIAAIIGGIVFMAVGLWAIFVGYGIVGWGIFLIALCAFIGGIAGLLGLEKNKGAI